MKVRLVLGSLVLAAGLVLSAEVRAQENSPVDIARAIQRLAKEIDNKRKDCLKFAAFLKANSDAILSGDLDDTKIETFARLSDGCSAKADDLFAQIDDANSYLDGGDSGDDNGDGGDDGDMGGAPAKSALVTTTTQFSSSSYGASSSAASQISGSNSSTPNQNIGSNSSTVTANNGSSSSATAKPKKTPFVNNTSVSQSSASRNPIYR